MRLLAQDDTPALQRKSCKLGETTPHVMSYHYLTSNPSLQSVRFFLQTRFRCKVAPPSRHSLTLRAHRHRLSAVARKKNVRSRAQGDVASSEKSPLNPAFRSQVWVSVL